MTALFSLEQLLTRTIAAGSLTLVGPDAGVRRFGRGAPEVTVEIKDRNLAQKLALAPDIALGKAYMDGSFVIGSGDIYDFFDLCFANFGHGYGHWLWRAGAMARRMQKRLSPWIEKYIFPGGPAPALSELSAAIERAGLYATDIEILRLHYADTLRMWRRRFKDNWSRIAQIYDDRFCRMWEFYLASCEAGFRHSGLVDIHIQLARRIDAVPLTRDDLYRTSI